MEKRINRQLLLMGFVTAFLSLILSTTIFINVYENQVITSLRTDLELVDATYCTVGDFSFLPTLGSHQLRVTVIDREGKVVWDSYTVGEIDDHSDRPEIQKAFEEGYAEGARFSKTLGEKTYYVAKQTSSGYVVRCSLPARVIYDYLRSASMYLLLIFIIVLVLSIWLSTMLTERLITPIRLIASNLDDPRLLDSIHESVYPELIPVIQELRSKRKEIRHKAKEIEAEHQRLKTVLEHMDEGMVLLDSGGYMMSINTSACTYLQISELSVGRRFKDVCDDVVLLQALNDVFDGSHRTFDHCVGGRSLRVLMDPVIPNNTVIGAVCLFVDVTERREIERMKQEFTANVSHELKTPLTSISGYAEMIENGMVRPEDLTRFAAHIRTESSRLLLLIADIIALSEIEEKGTSLHKETVDMLEVVKRCADKLMDVAQSKSITLAVNGLHTELEADPRMLFQLCYNLIDNGIRYNRENGYVEITVGDRMITVRDTGIGIPDEHKVRVFERFYRVDKSRSKETGGTGLGLAIVKHIADAHGATVTLSSAENVGTTICVKFP